MTMTIMTTDSGQRRPQRLLSGIRFVGMSALFFSLSGCDVLLPQPVEQAASPAPPQQRVAQAQPPPPPVRQTPPLARQPVLKPLPSGGTSQSLGPSCEGITESVGKNPLATTRSQRRTRLKNAVVVLGMDALEPTLIERMVSEGELPHFAQIGKEGFRSKMRISYPIVSPSVWTSLASGYPSDKHGIPNWTGSNGKPFRSMDVKVQRVWDVATQHNKTSWVLNWLLTMPVSSIQGVMTSEELVFVGGLDSVGQHPPNRDPAITSQMLVSPDDFCKIAADQVPALDWVNSTALDYQFDRYSVVRHPLLRDEATVRLFEALVGSPAPDLAMVYLSGADALSHRLWPFTDAEAVAQMTADPTLWKRSNDDLKRHEHNKRRRPFSDGDTTPEMLKQGRRMVEDYYRYLDSLLGRVMDRMDPKHSTLVLVSDHGFKTADQPVPLYPAHSDHGVLMGWGSQVKQGQAESKEPRDLDVAPTIYALLGLPVAVDMDGRILSEHFETPGKTTVPSYATASLLTTAARPVDFQRLPELQALGYVDEEGRPLDAVLPSQPQGSGQ